MKIGKLIKELDASVYNYKNVDIRSLSIMDTNCEKGSMYFAIPGTKVDGEKFVASAITHGAVCVVTNKYISECYITQIVVPDVREALCLISKLFYMCPDKKIKIIGVIGSNGKTTVSHMLYNILKISGKKVGLIGTLGIKINEISFPSNLTTPDPIELFYALNQMVNFGCEYCVMEISAHAIALKKVCGLELVCGIFTNISNEHLDFFQTMKKYARTKIDYFSNANMQFAVVNVDDKYGKEILVDNDLKCFTYGLYNPADTFAINIKQNLYTCEYVVNAFDKVAKVISHFVGEYNVYNSLAAITCAVNLGVSINNIVLAFNKMPNVSGRMEIFDFGNNKKVIADFAHTPDGFEKVLSHVAKYRKDGRIITMFGCVSYADKLKRMEMGKIAKYYSNMVILTSDNPDNTSFDSICDDIGISGEGVIRIQDRKQALEYGISILKPGDTLIALGKSGETKQKVNGVNLPYDELDVINTFLRGCNK